MPHKSKKKFIDKKKAVTFQLVHRSQKDPLAADEEAPQRVLVPVTGAVTESEIIQETAYQREQRLSAQRTYGIGFDDDYDYMQHLREPENQTAILIPKSNRVTLDEQPEEFENEEGMTEVLKDGGQSAAIKMPSVVFASKEEEDIGMLHRAIPPVGPQVQWDPDVIAALDEDFDLDDPENLIEDDFILQATDGPGEGHEDEYGEEVEENELYGSDVASWMSGEDEFYEEETKSRFTQYSMTSSVLPRTEQLTLLDDQFEKFYETYDDEKIGDLGQIEIDGALPVDNIGREDALKMLLGIKDPNPRELEANCENHSVKGFPAELSEFSSAEEENDQHDDVVELVKEVPKEKWDCESILSTYSNIYNHPKVIGELPKPIKLSQKTGIPLDTLPTRGLTARQLRMLDLQNDKVEGQTRKLSESSDLASVISTTCRKKDETKEEKAMRKQVVKDMRRERRAEKKATKMAFRHEKTRQHKEYLNMQQNLSGIRIS